MSELLDKLNLQQREAVAAGEGPTLVLAGPGSGKTRVLTHRIAYLIQEMGVRPWHIVAVTFTNKAAAEMRHRAGVIQGGKLDGLQIGTFHAICSRLLRVEADYLNQDLGLTYTRDFAIYDTDDQLAVVRAALSEAEIDQKKFTPGRILNAISAAKNELITPADFAGQDYFGEVVGRIYPVYQRRLVSANAMDFDDLLMMTVMLLRESETVRTKYQTRFEHVLVDEFQDTNQAQFQLVKLFGEPQRNIFVVGDEDQGIYAFRGADYRNVAAFRDTYPDAKVVLLEQNYRSTQIVLDAARAVINKNTSRTEKRLFTEREGGALIHVHEAYSESEEGQFVAERILAMQKRGLSLADIAVMYRTNAQSRAVEEALVKADIPYRLIGGVRFYQRQEIKDLLAYLRVVNNPNDEVSLKRTLNVPGRGIGDKSQAQFLAWARQVGSVQSALERAADGADTPLSGKAARGLADYARLILDVQAMAITGLTVEDQPTELGEETGLETLLDEITARTGYNLYLHQISDNDEQVQERMENINTLRANMAERADLNLGEYLNEVALVADVDAIDKGGDAVTMLTLHAAKGLEYAVVFLTGLEDGLLPHSRSFTEPDAMAEERRLMYVGLTRAKDELYLSYAFRRALYGDSMPGIPSRFIQDIPIELTQGDSPGMKSMRERSAYQRMTTWDKPEEKFSDFLKRASDRKSVSATYDQPTSKGNASATSGSSGKASNVIELFPEKRLKYPPGTRVYHASFGEGIVIDSKPDRTGDEQMQIRFPGVGVKLMLASFARLEILKGEQ